jgi:spermidine/putrescine transport system permease protein
MIRERSFWVPSFLGLIYAFLYLPIIVLITFSFNSSSSNYSWSGFTFDWYRQLLNSTEIWDPFCNSMIIGTSAVFLSILFALMFIWSLNWGYSKMFTIFYSTMLLPDIVIAVGLLIIFSFFAVPLGLTTLIAGHTLLGLGFAVPLIYSRYQELDQQVIEASLDLGASNGQTFRKIVIPFLRPAIISSMLSVFVLSLDDFLVSFFCAGSASKTLSLYIYAMVRAGVSPIINALSTVILIGSSILVLIFSFLRIRMEREDEQA